MKTETRIYGASDDLIEIEGAICDEHCDYSNADKGIKFSASDGTKGIITYDGEWRINVLDAGSLCSEKIASVGEDAEHTGRAMQCTSYSDVLIFDEGIEWIKIGRKTYKP